MNENQRTTLILLFLVSVFAWAGLTWPGYFELHHGFRPIFNLTDLARSLPAIGWAPVIGQPFDLWRGEGALPYWLALLPRGLGATPTTAIKLTFAVSLIGAALGIYGWARRMLGEWPALIAGTIYGLWPIGLATVYVRGALAEAVFLAIMPWLLGAATGHTRRRAVMLVPGMAAAVWTQAGLALWFAAVLLGYIGGAVVVRPRGARARSPRSCEAAGAANGAAAKDAQTREPRPYEVEGEDTGLQASQGPTTRRGFFGRVWPVVAGLALGLVGLVPVAARYGLSGQTYVNFAEHFVYLHQLLWPGWGIGPSVAGPDDTLTFQLGLIACGLAVIGLLSPRFAFPAAHAAPYVSRLTPDVSRFALLVTLILALLSTTLAEPLWRLLPFLPGTLTYPWQLLLLAGPWLALLAGSGSRALLAQLSAARREAAAPLVTACLLALTLLASYGYLSPGQTETSVPEMPLAIFGADEIALLDARPKIMQPVGTDTTLLQAGATISVTVHWQALRPLTRDYTVFLHLTDPHGQLQGQQDIMPRDNQLPTSRWRPGQIVADQYYATLKPGAPASADYRAYLGLYLWQTGERLRTRTDDKVAVQP